MLLATTAWSCMMVVALLATSISDILYRRIPNNMMLSVLGFGMVYWGSRFGFSGIAFASKGVAVGLLALMGFYVLGWMGAGDVKIFAAFGAVLGAHDILLAALFGLILGGLLSLLYLEGQDPHWHLLRSGRALPRARAAGQSVPLAAALCAGVLMVQMGIVL